MKKLLLLIILVSIQQLSFAQNYKFQSLFIFNIVKRISWPPGSNELIIGVMGSKELQKELIGISQKQKIGGKTIKVIAYNPSKNDTNDIHVLYLGRSASSKVDDILSLIKSKPILLIGDKPGLNGASINFLDNSKDIKFEIFPKTIKEHKLSVASSLLSLGIVKED